ncbi:MAG: MFS transporter [Dehalococcoidia bacterium]
MTAATTTTADEQQARVFYGWWIVAGAIVGYFVSVAAGAGSAGIFLRPIVDDLGWSVGSFTLAITGTNAVSGLAGFFIGPLVDKHGARPLMFVGTGVLSGSLLLISRVQAPWQFFLLQSVGVGIGISLVGGLVLNITMSKWFVLRRGWAIALGSTGISFASILIPLTLTRVVDNFGWRDGYVVLAIGAAILSVPVAFVMRRQPEDYGLMPDGRRSDGVGTSQADHDAITLDRLNSYTRREAVRTRALWLLTLSFGCFGGGAFGVLIHGIPFVTEAGFTRSEAAFAASVAGMANLIAKFFWGYTLARFHVRTLWVGSFSGMIVGVGLMLLARETGQLPLMLFGFFVWGLGFGGGVPLGEFIWAKYFGRVHIGAVRSIGMPIGIAFGAAGPLAVSTLFDATGTYTWAWLMLASVYVAGAVAVIVSREPPPKVTSLADLPLAAAEA